MAGIGVRRGDIARLDVDAIVNAANEWMLGGGGVDGAIHAAAGSGLLDACKKVAEVRPGVRCPTGEARMTAGFDLPAKHIIHTVGPVWRNGTSGEDDLLAGCYRESLKLARAHSVRSIAFPAISCGIFQFPPRRAASIAVREIQRHLDEVTSVAVVVLVAFDSEMYDIMQQAVDEGEGGRAWAKGT